MTDPAEIVSDMSDASDAVEEALRFRSDVLRETSDVSDGEAAPAACGPTRPTAVHECRTEKTKENHSGPTCPTRPTQNAPDWAALVALFSKSGGEPKAVGDALEASEAADEPNAAPPFPTALDRLDAFEERAAIREHDGGDSRPAAERAASIEQGFPDPGALLAAAADGWRRSLDALARRETSPRGRERIAAASRFMADGWAAKAAALGWTELELFGVDPRAPWARLDRMGVAWSRFTPAEVTRDALGYRQGPTLRRGSQADGAVLPWGAETSRPPP